MKARLYKYIYITISADYVPQVPSSVQNPHNNNFKSGWGDGGVGRGAVWPSD